MKLVAVAALLGQFGFTLHGVGTTTADPLTTFGQLGASGILATVLWLQLQKAEKRADVAESRTIAALQETVPVLALATERLSDKVNQPAPVTDQDVRVQMILEKIDRRLGGAG